MPTDLPPRWQRHLKRSPAKHALGLDPRVDAPIRETKTRHTLDCAVAHLVMAPIAALFFSTLMQGNTISMASLFRTLLLSAEAIAEAELGFGQGWIMGNI